MVIQVVLKLFKHLLQRYFVIVLSVLNVTVALGVHASRLLELQLPTTVLKEAQSPKTFLGAPTTVADSGKETLTIVYHVGEREKLFLNVTQAIALALKYNTMIRTAYISRISQRYQYHLDRRNRELWYYAQNGPQIAFSAARDVSETSLSDIKSKDTTRTVNVIPTLGFLSPIGTNLSLQGQASSFGSERSIQGTLSVTQPLLRGFGWSINRIFWRRSHLNEAQNVLGLRMTVSQIILGVIQQYRGLILANLTYESNLQGLREAKSTLKNTKIRVQAGQLAKSELLSGEISVQSAKNMLLASENDRRQQQRLFATFLGLKKATNFEVDNAINLPVVHLDEKKLIDHAILNKPDYLQAQLTHRQLQLNLKRAKNNQLWDLSLGASANKSYIRNNSGDSTFVNLNRTNRQSGNRVSLSLTIPLDNTSVKQTYLNAKLAIENDKIGLNQTKLDIIAEIRNRLNSLGQSYKALKIQEEQLLLQKKQVHNTSLALQYGKETSYNLAQQQQQLNINRNQLASSKIDYLNQLSQLDDYLGTALATWQIVLVP